MFRFVFFTIVALIYAGFGIYATLNNNRNYRVSYIISCYTIMAMMLIIGIVGLAK